MCKNDGWIKSSRPNILLPAGPPAPEPRCERRPPAPEQPRGGRRVRHGRYQLLEEEAVAPPRSGHCLPVALAARGSAQLLPFSPDSLRRNEKVQEISKII